MVKYARRDCSPTPAEGAGVEEFLLSLLPYLGLLKRFGPRTDEPFLFLFPQFEMLTLCLQIIF